MCKNCLAMHNMSILNSLKEMRKVVEAHKLKKLDLKSKVTEVKLKSLTICVHKLMANLMTTDENNGSMLNIRIKNLNEINDFDKVIKVLTNDDSNVPRWLSQCDHVNLFNLIDCI